MARYGYGWLRRLGALRSGGRAAPAGDEEDGRACARRASTSSRSQIDGRKIAQSFWGEAWCDHLESFSDFENRLPRGRTYVRNGSVCHLAIAKGKIEAKVSGSELYDVKIAIKTAAAEEVEGHQGALQRADRLAPGIAPGPAVRPRDGASSPIGRKDCFRCPAK